MAYGKAVRGGPYGAYPTCPDPSKPVPTRPDRQLTHARTHPLTHSGPVYTRPDPSIPVPTRPDRQLTHSLTLTHSRTAHARPPRRLPALHTTRASPSAARTCHHARPRRTPALHT
eukprot:384168-Prorocentrum_minimum.AAC.1